MQTKRLNNINFKKIIIIFILFLATSLYYLIPKTIYVIDKNNQANCIAAGSSFEEVDIFIDCYLGLFKEKSHKVKKNVFINNGVGHKKNNLYLAQTDSFDIEDELTENVENQLKDIDFSGLDKKVNSLSNTQKKLFGGSSFAGVVKNFLYGDGVNLPNNFISHILNIIFNDIKSLLPYFALIVAIAIIYSLVGQFSSKDTKSIASIVHISCFCAIALVVLKLVIGVMQNVSGIISNISSQMELVFPILLTLISAIGGTVTASTFQPILATLSTIITKIFTSILIPVFIFCIVFNVVGNISTNVKLEKFSKFCSSFFNWTIGIVFTIFIAFLTINGLTVSNIDGISIKTAKYAIKSYIPILGSYLSDGVSLIITSSSLIKNAVGVTGLILLISTVLSPILNIVLLMLLFKFVSAIIEPFCDSKISNFLYAISKSLNMLNTCLIAIGFMYLISISILMTCSNIL